MFGLLMLEEDAGFQETRSSRGSRRMIFYLIDLGTLFIFLSYHYCYHFIEYRIGHQNKNKCNLISLQLSLTSYIPLTTDHAAVIIPLFPIA